MTKKERLTYSKRIVSIILTIALIDLQVCIFFNRETIAVALITEIIGVLLVYSVKAYFGKKQEEANKILEKQIDAEKEFEEK